MSPAYDFVETSPYIAGGKLALNFGGSNNLGGITGDHVQRFTDTARLSARPVWQIVREAVEWTAAAWKILDQKDLLPLEIRNAIDSQIQTAIANTDGGNVPGSVGT